MAKRLGKWWEWYCATVLTFEIVWWGTDPFTKGVSIVTVLFMASVCATHRSNAEHWKEQAKFWQDWRTTVDSE